MAKGAINSKFEFSSLGGVGTTGRLAAGLPGMGCRGHQHQRDGEWQRPFQHLRRFLAGEDSRYLSHAHLRLESGKSGRINDALAALEKVKASRRRLILVTGRHLPDSEPRGNFASHVGETCQQLCKPLHLFK